MSTWVTWWGRLGTVLTAAIVSVLIPTMAWASSGPGEVVLEAARRRSRGGGFGFVGLLCCLAVVGVVVIVVLMLMRNRRSRR